MQEISMRQEKIKQDSTSWLCCCSSDLTLGETQVFCCCVTAQLWRKVRVWSSGQATQMEEQNLLPPREMLCHLQSTWSTWLQGVFNSEQKITFLASPLTPNGKSRGCVSKTKSNHDSHSSVVLQYFSCTLVLSYEQRQGDFDNGNDPPSPNSFLWHN